MRAGFFRLLGAETGGAMLELAVAMPLLLLLALGVADAREGARYAMVHGTAATGHVATEDSVTNYVKSKTSLDAGIQVVTTWSPDKKPGSLVTVTVKHNRPRRGPFLPATVDSSTSKVLVVC